MTVLETGASSPSPMLAGKIAVVTGGTRGIGAAIVEVYAEAGATVVYTGRQVPRPEPTGHPTPQPIAHPCDLADEGSISALFDFVHERFGGADVLVNNAAIHDNAAAHKMSSEQFRRVVDTDLVGTFLCSKLAALQMREHGRGGAIVNITSIASVTANAGQVNYVAAKAGVEAMTKVMARENARRGIRVNAIRPGLIHTDMTADMPEQLWAQKVATTPMGRPGDAHEVARAALFLASPHASYVTGVVLDVSGGRGM
ncbi:SDR family NAD(P)-dependent oxidoreductase [Micromonospora inositola]|uniref:3-oxoacyl-[acyl-carrier protein] reductase n=1 Tax=Micromonospora inositola TaxID=47865 RepID=A0A1C5JNF7_9ACTN|nr:SDR family NAD(P)-dependent oxidoreductase [Micromonospora inositola]SCG72013.1 3-oxoacyl-[acyl-carrier protein] reductase [Micromonospora inositola]